jgi:hypothetical protein
MNDVAELTLRINALEANQAAAALDKLEASGRSAAAASDVLTSGFQKLAAVLGPAALATAFVYAIKGALELEAGYVRLAQMAGTTASQISGLALVAATSGTSLESMATAMAKLNREVGLAKLGDMAAKTQMLKAIGIDPTSGDDPTEVFLKVSRALVGMRDQSIASKVAFDLLGRGFAELRPAMEELVRQGGLHKSVTDEQAAAAKRFEDGLSLLNHQMQLSKIALANDMIPWLQAVITEMNKAYAAGGLFAAAIAGIQTAVTGGDLAAANKEIFETGEKIEKLGRRINELGAGGKDRSPWYDRSLLADLNAQMATAQERLARATEYKRQLENPGSVSGQTPSTAPSAPGGPNEAELRVQKLLDDQKHYAQRLEVIKAFGAQYAEAIRVANVMADLANKEGGVQNQRTAEAMILQKAANDQAALVVQRSSLQAARTLELGKDPEDASGKAAAIAAAIRAINQKMVTDEAETQARIRAERTLTFQLQREQYNAWVASQASLGETIADSFMSQREIENKGYEDRKNALEVFINAQGEAYALGARLREQLEADHQAKLGSLEAQGAQQRFKLEQMTLREQASFYFGTLASITAAGAQHNRTLFELNKVASIANAVISTYEGATKALSWGWPLGPIFAGIITAAGAANIAVIAGTQFGSGTSAPSIGGGTAIPTTPAAGSPATPVSGQTTTIVLQGGDNAMFSRKQLRDLFDQINESNRDGARIIVQ